MSAKRRDGRELVIAQVWITECERCANDECSYEEDSRIARVELANHGWRDGLCPACNGVKR